MIIKFYDYQNQMWTIFDEVDSLGYRRLEKGESFPDTLDDDSGIMDYTLKPGQPCDSEMADLDRAVFDFMNKNQLAQTRIIAYRPIYLMNNDGRTIETI